MAIKTIILNGPPGSGKDVLGEALAKSIGADVKRFKDVLYSQTASFFGVPEKTLVSLATNRDTKEMPHPLFNGLSPRKALIYVSEEVIKPIEGASYFGDRLVEDLEGITVITDGGFDEEVVPVVEKSDYTLIVQLRREGYTFDGDSRSYISHDITSIPGYKCDIMEFDNKGHPDHVTKRLGYLVSRILLVESLNGC